MVNGVIFPDYIENLNAKISFSNYEIVADKKYEKQAMIFNNVLAKALDVDESKQAYHIEFFHNKDLRDNQYIIQMDNSMMHIEVGNKQALSLAINVVTSLYLTSRLTFFGRKYQPNAQVQIRQLSVSHSFIYNRKKKKASLAHSSVA